MIVDLDPISSFPFFNFNTGDVYYESADFPEDVMREILINGFREQLMIVSNRDGEL